MYAARPDGLAVPVSDRECMAAIKEQVADIDLVLPYCKAHHVAVQAGGNVGLWPLRLASSFDTVYTFEPDAQNFPCLAWNTRMHQNVIRIQAALGARRGLVGLHRVPENIGAHCVAGDGAIPMMTIDSLGLAACDLIYLDIEGHEPQALLGARATIARHHPVLAIEDKGLCDQHWRTEALGMLERMGYCQVDAVHRDKVFACSP